MTAALYHWSPIERRASIRRVGLVPGRRAVDGLWRPPYVCLATSPSLAWGLSGGTTRGRDASTAWDLWMVQLDRLTEQRVEQRPDLAEEYRVFDRIFKRHVWYVATRDPSIAR